MSVEVVQEHLTKEQVENNFSWTKRVGYGVIGGSVVLTGGFVGAFFEGGGFSGREIAMVSVTAPMMLTIFTIIKLNLDKRFYELMNLESS